MEVGDIDFCVIADRPRGLLKPYMKDVATLATRAVFDDLRFNYTSSVGKEVSRGVHKTLHPALQQCQFLPQTARGHMTYCARVSACCLCVYGSFCSCCSHTFSLPWE
jgi:hypothetical protein